MNLQFTFSPLLNCNRRHFERSEKASEESNKFYRAEMIRVSENYFYSLVNLFYEAVFFRVTTLKIALFPVTILWQVEIYNLWYQKFVER